jgi:hypothetical protein
MSLAKVTFINSLKVRHYGLCGCVAAYYIKSMVVCVHSTHKPPTQPHSQLRLTFTDLMNVTLARLICQLPDGGRRPKYVGAILI